MLFKRREKRRTIERVRSWVWPKGGWKRALSYSWRRLTRLSGPPHVIALGFAVGVFAAFTPFIGLHFALALIIALFVGGNLIAAALGTFVGNPLTFPLIWVATYEIGTLLLGLEGRDDVNLGTPAAGLWSALKSPSVMLTEVWATLMPIIGPMVIGAIPLGLLFASVCYIVVRMLVSAYQKKRRRRLARNSEGDGDEGSRTGRVRTIERGSGAVGNERK